MTPERLRTIDLDVSARTALGNLRHAADLARQAGAGDGPARALSMLSIVCEGLGRALEGVLAMPEVRAVLDDARREEDRP